LVNADASRRSKPKDSASHKQDWPLSSNICKETAIAFLKRALAWFARHGVTAEGVMTDNGSAYISRDFQAACRNTGLKHLRTLYAAHHRCH
jgi:transposase InsO family protein